MIVLGKTRGGKRSAGAAWRAAAAASFRPTVSRRPQSDRPRRPLTSAGRSAREAAPTGNHRPKLD
jgi:hypothetical protein